MALLLVIACFLASRVFSLMDNDTLFMPLAIFTACALLAELSYGMLLMACGLAANPLEALFTRALPCALYDCAVGPWWSTSSWRGCLPAAPRTAVCARRNCDRGRACSQLS